MQAVQSLDDATSVVDTASQVDTWKLIFLVSAAWLLWAIGTVHEHGIAKREGRVKPDSRVSLTPIIPIFPLIFLGLAKLVDKIAAPWGTWTIGGLHVLLVVAFVVAIVRQSMRRQPAQEMKAIADAHPRQCAGCGADRFYDIGRSFFDGPRGSGLGYFVECAQCGVRYVARQLGDTQPADSDWTPEGK